MNNEYIKSGATIGSEESFGTFITPYILVYGTLRTSELKKRTDKEGILLYESLISVGTFRLPEFKMARAGKKAAYPVIIPTNQEEDFVTVELLKIKETKYPYVPYEIHYILDMYEGIPMLYTPMFLKVQHEDKTYETKIYIGNFFEDSLLIHTGDFLSQTKKVTYKNLILC